MRDARAAILAWHHRHVEPRLARRYHSRQTPLE
jgi:hypothetical protein